MADKIEEQLAEGIEQDIGLKAMAEKFAPRQPPLPYDRPSPEEKLNLRYEGAKPTSQTVEAKLQQIEQLVREVRAMSAQVKGLLG